MWRARKYKKENSMFVLITIVCLAILIINVYSFIESKKKIEQDLKDMEKNRSEQNRSKKVEKNAKKTISKT